MRNPTRVGLADIYFGSVILTDEDRRAVAAYQRVQADYEEQLIATGLSPQQRGIVEAMRRHRAHLDFINEQPPATPPAEVILTHRELEDFAAWLHAQGFRAGVKAMFPEVKAEQITDPYRHPVFYFNLLATWRAERQTEESQS